MYCQQCIEKISARDSTLDVNRIATLLQTGLVYEDNHKEDTNKEEHLQE